MPKVSIIVPVYGVEKYIERCARSLFEQTLDDIEYLFIDDCTPDRSIEILKNVLEEYPNRKNQVIIHRMDHNSGQAAVRKWGMLNATGDYIIHCDSDDWVDVDMYRAMYEKAVEDDYDLVACDFFLSDGENHSLKKDFIPEGTPNIAPYIISKKTDSSLCNKLIKRTVYESAKIEFPSRNNAEDWATLSQLSLFIEHFTSVNTPFYYYYYNHSSITKVATKENLIRRYKDSCGNIKTVEEFFSRNHSLKKYNNELDALKINEQNILLKYIEDPDVYKTRRILSKELKTRPLFNPCLSFRDKLRYYSVTFKIYPILKRFHLI